MISGNRLARQELVALDHAHPTHDYEEIAAMTLDGQRHDDNDMTAESLRQNDDD